jgi:hypothetical protein
LLVGTWNRWNVWFCSQEANSHTDKRFFFRKTYYGRTIFKLGTRQAISGPPARYRAIWLERL